MQEQIRHLKEEGLLPMQSRVALGQKFLVPQYRSNGIVELLTKVQDNLVVDKYDIYLATVQFDNKPSELFIKKNLFKLIHQDDIRYYFSKALKINDNPMKQSITIEVEDQNIEVIIRPGEAGDELFLHELNKKWVKEALDSDYSKGFLTSLYTSDEFRLIIEAKEIVVAEITVGGCNLIGWCLSNNSIENQVYQFSKKQLKKLRKSGIINSNQSVALGLQWLIDGKFQGKGIIKKAFSLFKMLLKPKYNTVLASVLKKNAAGNNATNSLGMHTIFEDEIRYYKIIKF